MLRRQKRGGHPLSVHDAPNGTWGLDDETHPSYLFLYTEVDGMASDTLQYNLGGVVRTFDNVGSSCSSGFNHAAAAMNSSESVTSVWRH